MGRIKLKIKRLETMESILDTYAKRKSKVLIQEAVSREEEQKARVKEYEAMLNKCDAELIRMEDLKKQADDLTATIKDIEANYSSNKKKMASLHKTSKDPKRLGVYDAVLKTQEAIVKKVEGRKSVVDELMKIGDYLPFEDREKFVSDLDVERAKVKELEQKRKEIEKGSYLAIREGLRNKLAYYLDVERTKVKQVEQDTNEIEKGASLTSKESLEKNLACDIDTECAKAKQLEKDQKEIMSNFVEPGKDQTSAPNPEFPMSTEEATPHDTVKDDKNLEKGSSLTSEESFEKNLACDIDTECAKAKQSDKDQMDQNPELPMTMEEATPFETVKDDDKIVTIRIGEMNVPLCEPSVRAAQPEKPPANP